MNLCCVNHFTQRGGSGFLHLLVIWSLVAKKTRVMTFLSGFGYCSMSINSSAREGLIGIITLIILENRLKTVYQYFASLGHSQNIWSKSHFLPHCLQQELSKDESNLTSLSGIIYQR